MKQRLPLLSMTAMLMAGIVALAGCAIPDAVKHAAPPISETLGNQAQPAADVLPIIKSEPIASDPQQAIANYRAVLKLNPSPSTRAEALRRIADLQVQVQDQKGNPSSGDAKVDKSIDIYQNLLQERPDAATNDRLLYQMARAYQNTGRTDKAISTLQLMEKKYRDSSLMGDAHFRSGELLYQSKRYAEAASEYRIVMDLGEGAPFFEPAEYKYGWSLFKQQKYEQDIAVFFFILGRELPAGELADPKAALAKVRKGKVDLAKDAVRVVSLSFAELGGGPAVNDYFSKHPEPRYYQLIYNALGELFLEKQRYTDAAKTYTAFIKRHPDHPNAPEFQTKVIAAYKAGGFNDQVVAAKEVYANAYAPDAAYWHGKQPTAEVMTELRKDLEDLGRHYQAKADGEKAGTEKQLRTKDFATAASWYRRILKIYPQDPHAAEINMLLADSLYDGGQTEQAAREYEQTAYGYGKHPKASDAALAAVQAWQHLAKEVPPKQRPDVLRKSVKASLKLADTFPDHPKWLPVLTQAAVDLYEIKQLDEAVLVANRVLNSDQTVPPELKRTVYGVIADSRFNQGKYGPAEAAYTQVLKLTPADSADRKQVVEQLATSIYKQGEAARSEGNLLLAANIFLRVGQVVPDASIHPTADYDAAAALITLKDWPRSEKVLENFRRQFSDNKLIPDVDKKLAVAYQADNKPEQAAIAYQRIAARTTETLETRREAAWQAARLFDQAHDTPQAQKAFIYYVQHYPAPLDRAMTARRRVADIALAQHDHALYLQWLQNIVAADAQAGAQRDDLSRTMAAHASLELAENSARRAEAITLTQPLKKSLASKKAALESAVRALTQTAGYGIAETTTAATYDLGELYDDFGQDVLHSERPARLSGDELEQYGLLLEEQAEPFIDKAIKAHEANLQRVQQGLYDTWIDKSVKALGRLSPGKYSKREKSEASYDTLR